VVDALQNPAIHLDILQYVFHQQMELVVPRVDNLLQLLQIQIYAQQGHRHPFLALDHGLGPAVDQMGDQQQAAALQNYVYGPHLIRLLKLTLALQLAFNKLMVVEILKIIVEQKPLTSAALQIVAELLMEKDQPQNQQQIFVLVEAHHHL